jgi:hypothetical protein
MHVAQCGDHLEFDIDLIFDEEPALSHLVRQRILIDLFDEPMARPLATLKANPDDPLGYRLRQQRIPFIAYIPLIRLKKPGLAPPPTSNRARLTPPMLANHEFRQTTPPVNRRIIQRSRGGYSRLLAPVHPDRFSRIISTTLSTSAYCEADRVAKPSGLK